MATLAQALLSNPLPQLEELVRKHAKRFCDQVQRSAFNSLIRWTPPSAPGNEVRQTRIRTGAATGNGQKYDIPSKAGITAAHKKLMSRIKVDFLGSGDLPEGVYNPKTQGLAALYWQSKKIPVGTPTPGAPVNIPLMVYKAGRPKDPRPRLLTLEEARSHVLSNTHIKGAKKGAIRVRNSKNVSLGWVRKGVWKKLASDMSRRAGSFASGWTAAGQAIGSKAPQSVMPKITHDHHNNKGSALLSQWRLTASNDEVPSPSMQGYADRLLADRLQKELDFHTRTQRKFFHIDVLKALKKMTPQHA